VPAPVLIEACLDSVDSAAAAERGGAGRIELCDSLADGGTTPSAGMITAVTMRVSVPVFVIIRPRGGSFVHGASELDVMRRDIDAARRLGAAGLVFGVLRPDRSVDAASLRLLMDSAEDMPVTFHRAFDMTPDRMEGLEALVDAGVARVLTSGGAQTAIEGAEEIAALVRQADGRIVVMAGGGVREPHVAELVRRTGVGEIHVRGTRVRSDDSVIPSGLRLRKALLEDESAWEETDEARIRAFVSEAAQ
jgi:copper homeostasis protein